MGQTDVEILNEELETCKHFLVHYEMENRGHRVLIFTMETLVAHSLSDKLDTFFEKLKTAEKWNVVFGFVHKYVEDGNCP